MHSAVRFFFFFFFKQKTAYEIMPSLVGSEMCIRDRYVWGSPLDDVLQPLTTVDWAERNISSISTPGNERLLSAIDQQLAAGTGSAGLTQVIARMGVKYVVVRDDLDRSVLLGAWPARINQALATSAGMTRVAAFGPLVGNAAGDATNLDPPYPAVEIYRVAGAEPAAAVQPAAGTLRVYGAPESMLTLANADLLADRPVLLNDCLLYTSPSPRD